jgi:tetratricopeptide (TPR) repeat protein
MIAFQSGQDRTALLALKNISGVADASWLSGIAHIRSENWQAARAAFEAALKNGPALGSRFAANGVNAVIELAITPEITARIEPAEQATRLVLAEACQASGDLPAAAQILVTALDADRTDPVLAISLAEIALEAEEAGAPVIQLEDLAPHLERQADDPVIAASLVLYRARVAASLGNHRDAAARYEMVSTIMEADDDLAKTALYEQALCLREMGERTRFRQALSALHARDPSFADIRSLLG